MMKNIYLFLFILVFSMGITAQENLKQDLAGLLDSWHEAAADNDLEGYFELIDDEGVYIGTDSSEIWTRDAFYQWSVPHFQDEKGWAFTAISRNIYLSRDESMAWFDELLSYGKGTLRGSGVLILRGNQWRIIHYVLSIPVPNDKYSEVMKVMHAKPTIMENQE